MAANVLESDIEFAIQERDYPALLTQAIVKGNTDAIAWLLTEQRASPMTVDGQGRTILHLAVGAKQWQVLSWLTQRLTFDARRECGLSEFVFAELFLKKNRAGKTALQIAAERSDLHGIKCLLPDTSPLILFEVLKNRRQKLRSVFDAACQVAQGEVLTCLKKLLRAPEMQMLLCEYAECDPAELFASIQSKVTLHAWWPLDISLEERLSTYRVEVLVLRQALDHAARNACAEVFEWLLGPPWDGLTLLSKMSKSKEDEGGASGLIQATLSGFGPPPTCDEATRGEKGARDSRGRGWGCFKYVVEKWDGLSIETLIAQFIAQRDLQVGRSEPQLAVKVCATVQPHRKKARLFLTVQSDKQVGDNRRRIKELAQWFDSHTSALRPSQLERRLHILRLLQRSFGAKALEPVTIIQQDHAWVLQSLLDSNLKLSRTLSSERDVRQRLANVKWLPQWHLKATELGDALLALAVGEGAIACCFRLVGSGVNPCTVRVPNHGTLLHLAVAREQLMVIKWLGVNFSNLLPALSPSGLPALILSVQQATAESDSMFVMHEHDGTFDTLMRLDASVLDSQRRDWVFHGLQSQNRIIQRRAVSCQMISLLETLLLLLEQSEPLDVIIGVIGEYRSELNTHRFSYSAGGEKEAILWQQLIFAAVRYNRIDLLHWLFVETDLHTIERSYRDGEFVYPREMLIDRSIILECFFRSC